MICRVNYFVEVVCKALCGRAVWIDLMLFYSYVDYEAAACGGDNRSNSEANKAG